MSILEIKSTDEFRAAAKAYGVPLADLGRLPATARRDLAIAVMIAGDTITPTDFLRKEDAAHKVDELPELVYTVRFRTEGKDGRLSGVKSETLTTAEVVELSTGYKGKTITTKRLVMAVATRLNVDAGTIFEPGEGGKADFESAAPKVAEVPDDKDKAVSEIQELLNPISAGAAK